MDELAGVHLCLDFLHASTPVEGAVTLPSGRRLAFAGWMPLLSILEAAHAGTLPGPDNEEEESK